MEYGLGETLSRQGITDPRVLAAIMRVDRAAFVPPALAADAHEDTALPIGHAQTISQPSVVALTTSALEVGEGSRVLEVGTGSGYQAAVLAELGCEVYSVERLEPLAERAAMTLARLGYRVHLRAGDGTRGWREQAPFDAIVVTAAAPAVPPALVRQLRVGGRLVMPVGAPGWQMLTAFRRTAAGLESRALLAVSFVPLI